MEELMNGQDAHGTTPPAITISVVPHPEGQQVVVRHRTGLTWAQVQQLLLAALHIAVVGEVRDRETEKPPLIQPAQINPRIRLN